MMSIDLNCDNLELKNPLIGLHYFSKDALELEYQFMTMAADYFDIHMDLVHGYTSDVFSDIQWAPHEKIWIFNISSMRHVFQNKIHIVEVIISFSHVSKANLNFFFLFSES